VKKSLRIGNLDIYFRARKIQHIQGMCSDTVNGKHILMWDFDNTALNDVIRSLLGVQNNYQLPNIFILETKEDTNYTAYCFAELDIKFALGIVLETPLVCWNFWRLSVMRGFFTLRFSPKDGRLPHWRATLQGLRPADVGIDDLVHAVKYETGVRK